MSLEVAYLARMCLTKNPKVRPWPEMVAPLNTNISRGSASDATLGSCPLGITIDTPL